MSGGKISSEYERMKAQAPRILAEMVQMLLRWQKMGFHVPRGVKNIFEFTWEELMTAPPRKSFSGLYCPVVHFVSFEEEPTAVAASTPSKVQRSRLSGQDTKLAYEVPALESQELLQKFQKRSVHLLIELLKIKMKIMIDAVAGPTTAEIKRFMEGGQQLSPKTQEEANELMVKDPKKKGRGAIQTVPAIPITSTTQLIQQLSFSCLCFALSFKDTRGQKDQASSKGSEGTSIEPRLDPCPQAREMLREICRTIEREKAERAEKGETRPLILRNYNILHKSPSMALKRYPFGSAATERRLKGKRFLFAVPDGTSFLYYPSGNVAVCQFPICCLGKPVTLFFQDVPTQTLLGSFIPQGQSCVGYSFKCNCSIALLMNQEGGSIRDKDGYLTHRWTWYSKKQILRSLEFQVTENLKLSIRSPQSMTLTFVALNETFTMSLVRPECTHKIKTEKKVPPQSPDVGDQEGQWHKVLLDIKKRFEKTVRQFINGVLMASGICCIEYPVGPTAKHVKFTFKEAAAETWDRRIKEQASLMISESKSKVKKAGAKSPPSWPPTSFKPYKPRQKHPLRLSGAREMYSPQATWASYSADCPIILRKILTKEADITHCKCIVKIPLLTDMELERFLRAPRDPDQVLVICVLSTQSPSYSPYFEWSLEKIYIQMQHGRPSPCVQCKHDPFRFLKYDLDCPLNKNPPILVQKHGVMPGMVVMYAGGKLLFGGCVFNGYSYSRRDLMKQIDQVRLNYKMGRFLPPSFKFRNLPMVEPPKKPTPPEERTPEPEPKAETLAVASTEEAVVLVDEPEVGKKGKRSSSGKRSKRRARDI